MTLEEKELLYRILFENSDEEPTSAVYEIYDTITEVFGDITSLPQIQKALH